MHFGFGGGFNGNLTAFDQAVFRAKNLRKFSDIKLSRDTGVMPFLRLIRTVSVGSVTFSDPEFAERERVWPG
ncbi:MAG TPA: hypothetical protein VN798_18630 [Pseudomonas sp.]|nr:hypothetical protein [Pseudomonas sp.]